MINADGSGLRNVTNTATTSFDLAWSPDGRRIAYMEFQTLKPGYPPRLQLYVVNVDGTGKHRVTRRHVAADASASWSADGRTLAFTGNGGIYTVRVDGTRLRRLTVHGALPNWSSDGRQIAFLSSRDDHAHRASDLFVMNADGSGQRNLTHTPDVSEFSPRWAPS